METRTLSIFPAEIWTLIATHLDCGTYRLLIQTCYGLYCTLRPRTCCTPYIATRGMHRVVYGRCAGSDTAWWNVSMKGIMFEMANCGHRLVYANMRIGDETVARFVQQGGKNRISTTLDHVPSYIAVVAEHMQRVNKYSNARARKYERDVAWTLANYSPLKGMFRVK